MTNINTNKKSDKIYWNLKKIAEILNGKIFNLQKTMQDFTGITIDSRKIENNDVFIALRGNKNDGHDYVQEIVDKGFKLIIVDEKFDGQFIKQNKKIMFIVVQNTLDAIFHLAKHSRSRFKGKMIAITGSLGKTTTKDMLYYTAKNYKDCFKIFKSYNNWLGVNLMLINLPSNKEIAFFEIGANNFGEISKLSKLLKPDISIVTTIANSHIGNFLTLENILNEKMSIIDGMTKGSLIANISTKKWLDSNKNRLKNIKTTTFGDNNEADFIIKNHKIFSENIFKEQAMLVEIEFKNIIYKINFPFVGEHWRFSAAIICAFCCDLKIPICDFFDFKLTGGRGYTHKLKIGSKNILLIDDSYNAQLQSMSIAINNLKYYKFNNRSKNRIVCALGYMADQGEFSKENHLALSNPILKLMPDELYFSGEPFKKLYNQLKTQINCYYIDNPKDIGKSIINNLEDGDIIFVKGSRVDDIARMYCIVDMIVNKTSANTCKQSL